MTKSAFTSGNGTAIENLESRRLMSATVPLTGTIIGTAGSYNNSGNTIAKAFDGSNSTYFDAQAGSGDWAGLDLGTPKVIGSVGYTSRNGYASRMNGGIFQGGNTADFSSGVVNLYTIASGANPSSSNVTMQTVTSSTAFRYVRYLAPASSHGNVAELKFFGVDEPITQLTGTPFGTAGSYHNSGNTIAKVFDGNVSTFFDGPVASGDIVGLDFGSPQIVTQIDFAPGAGYTSRMVGGLFQGSNVADFSSGVVTLYTVTKAPASGTLTAIATNNSSAFRYVRYVAPASSSGNIAEAQFFTTAMPDPVVPLLQNALSVAETQAAKTLAAIGSSSNYPQYTNADGSWSWVSATQWTSGFFPGELWQLYQATGNSTYATEAAALTRPLSAADTQTSDNGFRLYDTFIPLLQQEPGNTTDINTLLTAAASKAKTYNATVGAFEAWRGSTSGNPKANFNVLMDLIMDSPLMLWAAQQSGNQTYYNEAVQNAVTEENYLVRADGSSSQFAYFDSSTGQFIDNETYEGYSNSSTWSRGQAWGIYGFTTMAAATGRADFLATAEKMADWYIAHLPADGVPYWDFSDPAIPNTYRDTSAAAVAASGLLKLSKLVASTDPAAAAKYRDSAASTLASLASSNYLVNPDVAAQGDGVLRHGALNVPTNTGDDSSISFGDYYFLEAVNAYLATPRATV